MNVEEVHFNHDPSSAHADALTIKYGNTLTVTAPEWRNGKSYAVAYTLRAVSSTTLIKARFSGGPPNGTRQISVRPRLLDAPPFQMLFGQNATQSKPVVFDHEGNSGKVDFVLESGGPQKVGSYLLQLDWLATDAGNTTRFGYTTHRIFVVVDTPKAPWVQGLVEPPNLSFPRVDALEFACNVAAGAVSLTMATELLMQGIYNLPNQSYEPNALFVTEADGDFNLTSFLKLPSGGFTNECRGVASAVVTFANLLGDRLCPLMLYKNTGVVDINSVRLIGSESTFQKTFFGRHEVAVRIGLPLDENLPVTDACLQFGNANNPIEVFRMPLGHLNPNGIGYLFELIGSGDFENQVVIDPRPVF